MKNTKDFMETGYLTGIAYFAQVHYPQDKFNSKKYIVQLGLEGAELEKARKEYKLRIKEPNQWIPQPHVEIKKAYLNRQGIVAKEPEVIDALNNTIPKTIMIGNGSTVKVKFGMYDNTKGNNGAYMNVVKVLKLVEFVAGKGEESEFMAVKEDGFKGVLPDMKSDMDSDDDIPFEPTKKGPVKAKVTTTG